MRRTWRWLAGGRPAWPRFEPDHVHPGSSRRMQPARRRQSGIRCPIDRARRPAPAATSGSKGAGRKWPGRSSMESAVRGQRDPRRAAETGRPIDPGRRGATAGPQFGAYMDCRANAAAFKPYNRRIPQSPDVLPSPGPLPAKGTSAAGRGRIELGLQAVEDSLKAELEAVFGRGAVVCGGNTIGRHPLRRARGSATGWRRRA